MNETTKLSSLIEFTTYDGVQLIGLSNINESLSTHYIVYKIHNLENGKYYIGQHMTSDPFDAYMGSGKLIQLAIKKYGITSFVKEILFDFDSFEQMNQKEIELVPLSACHAQNPMSYNIREGGNGQIDEETSAKLSKSIKQYYNNLSKDERDQLKIKAKNRQMNLSQETKDRISQIMHYKSSGKNNPMYGHSCTEFMTDEEIIQWKNNSSKATKECWKRPEYREKILALTFKNPNVDHDCRKYMTNEEIAQWKSNISKATSGKNNPMYGKSSWEKCTPEQRADRARRFSQNMKGKNKGRKMMQMPGTNQLKFVKAEEVQQYLDQGYVFSSKEKRKTIANISK